MSIQYEKEKGLIRLNTRSSTYAMQLLPGGYLAHLYYGPRVGADDLRYLIRYVDRPQAPNPPGSEDRIFSLNILPQEYPGFGCGDYRSAAVNCRGADGCFAADLRAEAVEVLTDTMLPVGLPHFHAFASEAHDTLRIRMADPAIGLQAELYYTLFEEQDAIVRWTRFINGGETPLILDRAMSFSLDFAAGDFDWLQLWGGWSRERHVERSPLRHGIQAAESRRGASSSQHNPFIALASPTADETQGEVYGFALAYSGNHLCFAEKDQYGGVRVGLGIHPEAFAWTLEPGGSFDTPQCAAVYASDGLGGMSRKFHLLIQRHLCRGPWRDRPRPVLINNWEATYFQFNADKLAAIAADAARLGIEMLVMDDGWFGKRDDDRSGLGDWTVNEAKLGCTLPELVSRIREQGLQFGIWFEPEMVSPDSDLYRRHPDWILKAPSRTPSLGRSQYVLDMSRPEVVDYLYGAMAAILRSAEITYVKWDMNRYITEAGSAALSPNRQGEVFHRYILGVYRLLDQLTADFPEVLFEGCASGGGRFDPGMLYYTPQIWTSDDTDAIERLSIQYGTSLLYPPACMACHVSAVPNHQVARTTPLETRTAAAMAGVFGCELDLTTLSREEKEILGREIARYKRLRPLIMEGELYRLKSPFEKGERGLGAAWMLVSRDKTHALVTAVQAMAIPDTPFFRLRLQGLLPQAAYRVEPDGFILSGAALMGAGLNLPYIIGDYGALTYELTMCGG